MTGEVALPLNVITAKEFDLRGTFRFHQEFDAAAALIGSGRIDLSPLLTATRPISEAKEAFLLASDRARSMKVQLAFA
jgi:L-idonate 5-dehydrogenase